MFKTLKKNLVFLLFGIFGFASCSIPYSVHKLQVSNQYPYEHLYFEGVQHRLFGNPEKALKSLRAARNLDDSSDAIHFELALSFLRLNQLDSAIHSLVRAVYLSPDNYLYHELLSDLYIENKDIPNALYHQKYIASHDTTNVYNKFQLSILYASVDSLAQALNHLSAIEETYGFNPAVTQMKMKIYFEQNKYQQSMDELNKLKSYFPEDPYIYLFESELLFSKGYDSTAFSLINEVIDLHPEYAEARFELFNKTLMFGKVNDALHQLGKIFLDESIDDLDKAHLFYPLLYDKYLYNNNVQSLDSIVTFGLRIHPTSPHITQIAFEHFLRSNNLIAAKDLLQSLLRENPNVVNVENHTQLIQILYTLNDYDELLNALDTALTLFPDHADFYHIHFSVLLELDRVDEALSTLQTGISIIKNPSDLSDLYGTLGDYYYEAGHRQKSYKNYKKALNYNSENSRVLNNYAYYLSLDKKKLKRALKMSSLAVELDPNSSTYIDTKGWILFQMKRYSEAKDVLRNAVAKDGDSSAVIAEHYGDALYMSGNKENAYIYWLKARDLGGDSDKLKNKIHSKTYIP